MKYAIVNLGCKVNAFEAEAVSEMLSNNGHTRVSFDEQPDATIVFTCAVTNTAAAKSRKILHQAKRIKEDEITALVGCYVQVNDGLLEEADILVGSANKKKLPQYIEQYLKDHKKIRDIASLENVPFDSFTSSVHDSKARCDLKIQDGCNQFCSYCIIPYARGRERSMEPDLVIAEAKRLSKKYKEIVLTGIHTGRYGKEYNITLTDIIRRILIETENVRIRISSIEITEVSDDLIQLMKENDRMTKFLHIPLQSGCDSVLKRMHRPYDTEEYYAKIEKIRKEIPGVSISTDLITGFPQESEQEFLETYEFLKKCHFSFLHVFPYSLREGTAAAKMNGQIDPQVKKLRTKKCIALSEQLYDTYQLSKVNERAEIIAEWVKDGYTTGHTSEYISVKIEEELVHGEKYTVVLERYEDHQMYARKVSD